MLVHAVFQCTEQDLYLLPNDTTIILEFAFPAFSVLTNKWNGYKSSKSVTDKLRRYWDWS